MLVYSHFSTIHRTDSVIIVGKVRIILLEIIQNLLIFSVLEQFGILEEQNFASPTKSYPNCSSD